MPRDEMAQEEPSTVAEYLGADALNASRRAAWLTLLALVAASVGVACQFAWPDDGATAIAGSACYVLAGVVFVMALAWNWRAGRFAAAHLEGLYGFAFGHLLGTPRSVAGCRALVRRKRDEATSGRRRRFAISIPSKDEDA